MTTLAEPRALPRVEPEETYTYERMQREFKEANLPSELWDGKVVMAPAPFSGHQIIVANFYDLLKSFVQE
ncbi:MAG: hypothetical protein ACO1QB_05930 [Verrucomicrobiales bacterium]